MDHSLGTQDRTPFETTNINLKLSRTIYKPCSDCKLNIYKDWAAAAVDESQGHLQLLDPLGVFLLAFLQGVEPEQEPTVVSLEAVKHHLEL